MKRKLPGVSYLLRQLRVVILGGGKDEDGAEGGHVLQQGEEGAFHSVAHRLPPLRDVWHEYHAGRAAAGLAENLRAARTGFKSGSGSESSRGWQLSRWVGAFYLSAGLLRRLRTDRVESRQIQAVDGQLLQVVQQGRGQVGAQSRARSAGQEEAWPVRCGLLKSRTDRTTRENMVRAEFQIFTINSVEVQKIVFCGSLLLVCPTQYRSIKKIFKEDYV